MKTAVLILCAVVVAGCVSQPPVTDADRMRTYTGVEAGALFDAVRIVLLNGGLDLLTTDKSGGLIKARKILMSTSMTKALADQPSGIFAYYDIIFLQGQTVRASIYVAYGDGSNRDEGNVAGYQQFWDDLDAVLVGK